jgi:hypothetical protein
VDVIEIERKRVCERGVREIERERVCEGGVIKKKSV